MTELKISDLPLPYSEAANQPLSWGAHPTIRMKYFSSQIRRAVGFQQRTKWWLLKFFLESPLTVKDLQVRLDLRRPGKVADYFFQYRKKDERSALWIDLISDALDVILEVKADPFPSKQEGQSDIGEHYATTLPAKVFTASPLTPGEAKYIVSGGKLHWYLLRVWPPFD